MVSIATFRIVAQRIHLLPLVGGRSEIGTELLHLCM
jgi:hypothetical protein